VPIDPALVFALALTLGGAAAVAPVPTLLGAAGVVCLLVKPAGPRVLGLGCLLLGLGTWHARTTLHDFEARRVQAKNLLGGPRRCAGSGVVAGSPTWLRGAASLYVEFSDLDCEGRRMPVPSLARLYGGPANLGRGDAVFAVADLASVQLFRNADLPDPTPLAARRGAILSGTTVSLEVRKRAWGIGAGIDALRAHARGRIMATFTPRAEGLARALVLGENDLDPEDDTAFKLSGLAHLLAVSGTHLVLAVVSIVEILRALLVRWSRLAESRDVGRWSAAFGVGFALVYADFAGGSGSAMRAAWMLAAAFLARALGRHFRVARSFACSLGVGALGDPLLAFDISFLLSAAATAGLVLLGSPCARACESIGFAPARHLGRSVAATVSAMLPCVPLLAVLSPEITAAGVLANVIAAPLGEMVALPLCLLHVLLGPLPALERGVALVGSGALLAVREVALLSSRARWLACSVPPPDAWSMAVLLVGSVGGVLAVMRRQGSGVRRWAPACLWLSAVVAGGVVLCQRNRQVGRPQGMLRVTAVDVGQGDSTLVDLPDGKLMLVDGGGTVGGGDPGKSVLLPLLRQRQRRRIDIAVLTHEHPDHLNGLATVLTAVDVGEFWFPFDRSHYPNVPALRRLVADLDRRGVPVRSAEALCGRPHAFGGAEVRVLSPCDRQAVGEGGNDSSVVLHITFGERSALLPGDAEAPREHDLVRRFGAGLHADVLKAGHHGSRTSSTTDWLAAVRPSWATISSGVRNPHGHPHPATLARLAQQGALALRLDRMGSVEWSTDGRTISIRAFDFPGS
jgi:competence protein ComEC